MSVVSPAKPNYYALGPEDYYGACLAACPVVCQLKRRFMLTTDSRHGCRLYASLLDDQKR